MSGAERISAKREKNLIKTEREQLVTYITAHTQRVISNPESPMIFSVSWSLIEPYKELFGMMGILIGDETLTPSHRQHLRRMIAVQASMVPKDLPVPGLVSFLLEVKNHVGLELDQAQELPEDFQSLFPRSWGAAYADVIKVDRIINGQVTE